MNAWRYCVFCGMDYHASIGAIHDDNCAHALDRFRWCVYCGTDCQVAEPAHSSQCPSSTGLHPVRFGDAVVHRGMCCCECGLAFKVGDVCTSRPTEYENTVEIVCVPCSILGVAS